MYSTQNYNLFLIFSFSFLIMIKEIMLVNTSEIINVIQTKVTTFIVTVKYDLSILY